MSEVPLASMAYLSEPLKSRVFFGPFPTNGEELKHLLDTCGVTHIVNMKARTTQTTKSGRPSDTWYSCFYEHERSELPEPEMMRFPLPKGDTKRRDLVTWYTDSAQRIATEAGPDAIYYVHHDTGLHEEALLAFVLCHVLRKNAVPDVDMWVAAHPQSSGVLRSADQCELLRECLARLNAAGAQPMDRWVKKLAKRAKVNE